MSKLPKTIPKTLTYWAYINQTPGWNHQPPCTDWLTDRWWNSKPITNLYLNTVTYWGPYQPNASWNCKSISIGWLTDGWMNGENGKSLTKTFTRDFNMLGPTSTKYQVETTNQLALTGWLVACLVDWLADWQMDTWRQFFTLLQYTRTCKTLQKRYLQKYPVIQYTCHKIGMFLLLLLTGQS